MLDSDKILSKNRFCGLVEDSVREKRHSYVDAVLEVCDTHDLETEKVKALLNKSIIDKIEHEARELNYLEKVNTLPI